MKYDWKKSEKELYAPKDKPAEIYVKPMQFFTISGEGNPNSSHFQEYVQVLYSLSYAIRMSHKSGNAPDGYFEYGVYPLEGVWDLKEEARDKNYLDKDSLIFDLMIRQPDFVSVDYALKIIELTKKKKPSSLLEFVKFGTLEEGKCVQILHTGSYDDEPASFDKISKFCTENNLERLSKIHREIYLSDARKTAPEKLKTILRVKVK